MKRVPLMSRNQNFLKSEGDNGIYTLLKAIHNRNISNKENKYSNNSSINKRKNYTNNNLSNKAIRFEKNTVSFCSS